jgi:hypothetical protein
MKDIEDLWNEIPKETLREEEINAALGRKSVSEVEGIKRLLLIELYSYLCIVIVTFFIHEMVEKEITVLIYATAFLCFLLNIITLRKIKKFKIMDDVKSFLKNALIVLKAFVTGFILTIQIVGVFVIVAVKLLTQDNITWSTWLLSEQGISTIVLFLIIEVILLYYLRVFYITRIYSLKKILREMDK